MKLKKIAEALFGVGFLTLRLGPAEGVIVKDESGSAQRMPIRSMMLKPYNIGANVTLTEVDHAGRTGVFNVAAGATVTLPRSTGSGAKYRFAVKTTVTSNAYVIAVGNADDVIQGSIMFQDIDNAGAALAWTCAAGSDTLTLNGGTKGGFRGDVIEIEDAAEGVYIVTGVAKSTGSDATPFSSAV